MKAGIRTSHKSKGLGGPRRHFFLLIVFMLIAMPRSAFAVCSSPAGGPGDLMYNSTSSMMQYCDDTNWIAMGSASASSVMPGDYTTGLVGHWTLDETGGTTANDSTVNNNDATMGGGLDAANDSVPGTIATALDFDGTDDYIEGPASSVYDFGGTDPLTMSAWVYVRSAPDPGDVAIPFVFTDLGQTNSTNYDKTITIDENMIPSFWIYDTALRSSDGTALLPNTWYHLVGTYDGTNVYLYVNGVRQPGTAAAYSGSGQATPVMGFVASAVWSNAKDPFDGLMDDVRAYNRALSQADVAALYGATIPPDITTGLINHWTFDETSGTTANDSAGTNDGTLEFLSFSSDSALGQIDGALQFDGTDQKRVTADTQDNMSEFTACSWINPGSPLDGPDNEPYVTLLNKGFLLGIDTATEQVNLEMPTSGSYPGATSDTLITPGQWYHICAVYRGVSGGARLYIQGLPDGTGWGGGGTQNDDSAAPLYMGTTANEYGFNYNGLIDDVLLYDRALGPQDIWALYGGTAPCATAGDLNYNNSTNQMQFCNGANWIAMGPPATGGDYTSSMIAHWPLDETSGTTAYDTAGNYDGTMQGGMTATTATTAGQIGTAMDYDAVNDTINAGSITGMLNVPQLTVSAWLKRDAVNGNTHAIASDGTGTFTGIGFYSDGELYFALCADGSYCYGSYTLNDTDWHHVTMVFDGTQTGNANRLRGYVDGLPVTLNYSSTIPALTHNDNTMDFHMGLYNGAYTEGKIDDVRIYDRALSPADVVALYDATGGATPDIATGLAGHWTLNETSGATAADSSGSSNNGTLIGGPAWAAGHNGNALTFDGTARYVTMGDINSMDGLGAFTLSAWIKTTEIAAEKHIVDKSRCDGYDGAWELMINGGTVNVMADNTSGGGGFVIAVGTVNVADGQWHHVTGIYDGSTTEIYVDGNLDTSTPAALGTLTSTTYGVDIGGHCNGYPYYWNGQIDDVRVYTRALSALDIAALYASSPLSCSSPAGAVRSMLYNSTYDVMQYCNGAQWVPVGKTP